MNLLKVGWCNETCKVILQCQWQFSLIHVFLWRNLVWLTSFLWPKLEGFVTYHISFPDLAPFSFEHSLLRQTRWSLYQRGGNYKLSAERPRWLTAFLSTPRLFLAIIKEQYEENFGYQYMCNSPAAPSPQSSISDPFLWAIIHSPRPFLKLIRWYFIRRVLWWPEPPSSANSFHLTHLMRLWYMKMTYSWAINSLVMDTFLTVFCLATPKRVNIWLNSMHTSLDIDLD